MNNPVIQLESTLSADDYVKANRSMLFPAKSFIFITILSIISLIVCIFYLFAADYQQAGMFLILPIVLLVVFFMVIPYRIKSFYKRSKKLHDKIRWAIDDNGFVLKTNDVSEKYAWNEFQSAGKTKELYLLILKASKKAAKIIPVRAFKNDDEIRIFEGILDANKIKRRK